MNFYVIFLNIFKLIFTKIKKMQLIKKNKIRPNGLFDCLFFQSAFAVFPPF